MKLHAHKTMPCQIMMQVGKATGQNWGRWVLLQLPDIK